MAGESLSVVVMAYNEAENLPDQVEATIRWLGRACPEGGQVVVVDDGSTDGTGEQADRLAAEHPEVTVVHHPRNLGMGRAIWSGYLAARGEWVTQLPGDGQVPPEALDALLARRGEADLVLSTYRDRGDGPLRRVVTLGFQATAWVLLGNRCRFTGTMLFRRRLLQGVTPRSDSFLVNVELPLRWMRQGVRPVFVTLDPPRPRVHGRSKVLTPGRLRRVVREMWRLRRELRDA